MITVNVYDAKTNLSRYINALNDKKENAVIIAKSGKPVAKIIPYEEPKKRIGAAAGRIPMLESLSAFNSIDVDDDFLGDGGIL